MSRRSSAVRSQSLVDYSETDLNKLQQQYSRAEASMRAYTEKTQGLIIRDRREIQRLQDEREDLLCSLRVSQSSLNRWADASVVQDLTATLACGVGIDEELEAEKAKVASLKDEVKGRKCFSKLMTRNGELREELKTMQVEKKQFFHVQSRLDKELHAIRKDICNLMTKCTEAFNASVKIQEKQRMLMDQNAKDVTQYIKEKSNLELEIAHYSNFEAFLNIKAIARENQDIGHRQVEKQQLESKELGLEDFEDAIKKILSETEESDLDKLVRNFIQMEEQNYTLLKFVNYQNNEVEAIGRQISQLCDEREIFVAEEQQQQEQHHDLLMRVSIKQEATEQQLAVYQQRVEFMEKLLYQLRDGLKILLHISCGSSVICGQLGSSGGVQEENIKENMTMVEDRVNELLTLQSYLHFQDNLSQWDIDSLSTTAEQLLGISPPAVNLTTAAATPAPDDDPDLVESVLLEAKEPVSRADLLTLVNKRIQRKKKRLT
ncbi:coiled-coil domain-containing protein 114-like isoform X4 [Micropterus salmoides]|uniref:coiled-coil domain-containing protein 114-like isoform X4 n=1 Tax=Micropterus salmoides TaxID=27706 RepID=UPI0018ED57BD|nr:coiled-coil domain-containing protein 114-like isoform X4 [Micropterus salmoides]